MLELEGHLLLDGRDAGRQQAAQPEEVALLLGEGPVLVQEGLLEQVGATVGDLQEACAVERCGDAATEWTHVLLLFRGPPRV